MGLLNDKNTVFFWRDGIVIATISFWMETCHNAHECFLRLPVLLTSVNIKTDTYLINVTTASLV